MTLERKVWIVVLCIIVVAIGIAIIEFKKMSDKDYKRSLNETPYLITDYGNGTYLIEANPLQSYYYGGKNSIVIGLAKIRGKCNITAFKLLNAADRLTGILVTTIGPCEVAATPYKRLH